MVKTKTLSILVALWVLGIMLSRQPAAAQTAQTINMDQAMAMALANDPGVAIARSNLSKAQKVVEEKKIGNLPQATVNGEIGERGKNTESQSYQVSVQETFPTKYHLFGKDVVSAVEQAQWDVETSEKELQIACSTATYNTKSLYLSALKAFKALRYQEDALKNAQSEADFAKEQLALGKIIKTDQLQKENDRAKALYNLNKCRQDYAIALKKLAKQLGVTNSESLVLDDKLPPSTLPESDYAKLKEAALAKRAELQQSRITVQKAEQTLAQTQNDGLPSVSVNIRKRATTQSLGLDYNLISGDLTGTAAWQSSESKKSFYGIDDSFGSADNLYTLKFTWKLDFGSAAKKVEEASYSLDSAKLTLSQSRQDIELEIDQAISDYEVAASLLQSNREALPYYETDLQLKQLQTQLGRATVRDVAKAELALEQARIEVEKTDCDLRIALERLRQVLGEYY